MSSPYPILNNRPIDQWKVTELKEELRKRSLKINGLKEELVRRLADALHTEMEEDEKEEAEKEELGNGADPDNDPEDKVNEEESAPMLKENSAEHIRDEVEEKSVPLLPENNAEPIEDKSGQSDNDNVMVDNTDSTVHISPIANDGGQKEMGLANLVAVVEDSKDNTAPLEKNTTDSQTGVVQAESSDRDTMSGEKNKDSKPSAEDAALNVPESTNQVSEVSTDLGFQVKSDSISTDSVSINEKNELKDNLNANNVHLELEVVKAEMVQPSSSDVPTIGGDSHQLEDDKELVDSQVSLEGAGDVACATDVEVCKKIAGVDEGSPEKLNLDRSSGDESMEEDVLETKQIESKNNSEEGERKDIKEDVAEVANPIDALVSGFSPEKKDMASEEDMKLPATVEKRKAEDQDTVNMNSEPKRQRRWSSDSVKSAEMQTSNVTSSSPKDVFQPAFRRSFSRTDYSLSGDAPKERIVPPSQKPTTTSLRIDRFLRPFTLKAVQELLAKTGTVSDFWMDQIKTHCYVTYSSVDEAIATRNALYNLQWPTNGGRQLVAEFVDPQEVKMKQEAPPQSPAPITPGPTNPISAPFQPQPQAPPPLPSHIPPLPPLPSPPALANAPPVKERLPPPPPLSKKPVEPPIMTLDDLFKKTKVTPRIYYLPLTEEQVAAKIAEQGKKRDVM